MHLAGNRPGAWVRVDVFDDGDPRSGAGLYIRPPLGALEIAATGHGRVRRAHVARDSIADDSGEVAGYTLQAMAGIALISETNLKPLDGVRDRTCVVPLELVQNRRLKLRAGNLLHPWIRC